MDNELTAGQWLRLDEKTFRVTSGEAELYVVCRQQRKFLSTATVGDFFCGVASNEVKILAIVVEPLKLEVVDGEVCEWLVPSLTLNEPPFVLPAESEKFCREYAAYFQRESELAVERLENFVRTKELIRHNSQSELLNAVANRHAVARAEDKYQPPLVHAVREIGNFLGVPRERIRLSAEACRLTDTQEILRQLATACGLYGRRVELADDWFRKDLGALLLFREGKPFAALPVSPNRYEFIDLERGLRIPVDEKVAETFDEQAYCFYRSIPDEVDSLWKWFKWASRLSWQSDWFVLLFCCLIAGLIPVVTPLVTQTVFEDIIPAVDKQAHLMVVQVMFVTSISGALTQLVRGITILRIKNSARRGAEPALWLKLLSLPASFFRKYQVGDLALRMQGISQLSHQLSSAAASGLFSGIFCFWNLLVMFYYSSKLALLAVFIWAIYFLVTGFFSWKRVKFQREKTEASGKVSGQVLQLLTGLNKFKLRAAEERAFYLWTKVFGREWQATRKVRKQTNWLEVITQSRPLVLNFCIFWFAISLFDESQTSGAEFLSQASFLSFNAAMGSFGSSVSSLQSGMASIWEVTPALERIRPILTEHSETSEARLPVGELSGAIDATGIDFRYKKNSPLVLKNISVSVRAGEFLALVGSSGSGKSTLMRILLGLEHAEKGTIFYDGYDLSQVDVTSVRRQIGVVMQQGQLVSGSIFSNIVGSLPLTIDDAWELARLVGLEKDIRELPMGMHTLVNEGGTTFSGGQRQRILIARSLANRPRIVFFDEATSALDNETQAMVSETLDKMRATRIVVAHRLSTIKNADRILVVQRGEIVEEGNYDELMARNGIFTELASRQLI
ncbi:MAG: NHLP bacteriocin export ABC transporter permease/ATPase subunit [Selenomonadaceae bacterium]|nr:NHLP bacteriocin export ABC transporter permease/ATPase subunit [Selenomonadaceae bacterium]